MPLLTSRPLLSMRAYEYWPLASRVSSMPSAVRVKWRDSSPTFCMVSSVPSGCTTVRRPRLAGTAEALSATLAATAAMIYLKFMDYDFLLFFVMIQ